MNRRLALAAAVAIAALAIAGPFSTTDARAVAASLPSRLRDQEFWRIVTEFSEPSGTFHSANLVSNEARG